MGACCGGGDASSIEDAQLSENGQWLLMGDGYMLRVNSIVAVRHCGYTHARKQSQLRIYTYDNKTYDTPLQARERTEALLATLQHYRSSGKDDHPPVGVPETTPGGPVAQ